MKPNRKHLAKGLQYAIAIVGITWIVLQLTIRDRVNVLQANGLVQSMALRELPGKPSPQYSEASPQYFVEGSEEPVPHDRVVSQPDRKTVVIAVGPTATPTEVQLLGIQWHGDPHAPQVDHLVVRDPDGPGGRIVEPTAVVGGFTLRTPRPLVEKGLLTMGRTANPWLLALAILICPATVLLSAVRWDQILRSQEIRIPFARVFVLNMVGNFYNSFLPGSTGGDFFKAYFVSRQTTHKIRAMLSVFADRVIGLLALVMLGGGAAAFQYFRSAAKDTPTAIACGRVAAACALITFGAAVGGLVLASRSIRTALGFDWFAARLPMQHHLAKVRGSARLYRRHAPRVLWWIAITFPIHITIVVSAILAGRAFGLGIAWPYYFVCVPVMILVAALPLAPQGAGVMEYFGFLLLAKQGATVSEVLAITLSIRFVQIFWNLMGGLFTLGGNFATPVTTYDDIADEEEPPEPDAALRPTPA